MTMTTELEKAKFYLGEAHAFFDFMNETRRKIDDKIYNMITLSGALITIVFGVISLTSDQKNCYDSMRTRIFYSLWLLIPSGNNVWINRLQTMQYSNQRY